MQPITCNLCNLDPGPQQEKRMVYHLLNEPFSTTAGVALSRVVADMLRFDEKSAVFCPNTDGTWGYSPDRVFVIPALRALTKQVRGSNMRGWRYFPYPVRRVVIAYLFRLLLGRLNKGDVVWCHNWPYVAEALVHEIHGRGALLIYHAHNSIRSYAGRNLFDAMNADAFIFNSRAMQEEALSLVASLRNTHVVHNGADEHLFHPPAAPHTEVLGTPTILFVGRLLPIKGVHVLVEAMRILAAEEVDCICKIVGSAHAGATSAQQTSYIRSLHRDAPKNVEYLGFRSATDIAKEYRMADVFCCPSTWEEPFGLVNIEAMASGLPVVASAVGGIREIAAEGGFLLVPPDSASALASSLKRLVLDRDLRKDLAAAGLSSFNRRFTSKAVVGRYYEVADALRLQALLTDAIGHSHSNPPGPLG